MAYAEDLSALRPSGMISIRGIIGKEANSSCAEQGVKYLELVQQVGGEVASICGRDWDNALTAFPPNFGLNTEFELTHPAANTALNVTVNGMPETSWALDIGSKTLVSTSSSPPNRNAEIHVQYQIDECLTP